MELITAARRGDLIKLTRALNANADVHFRNPNYSAIPRSSSQSRKTIYCGECRQQVTRQERPALMDIVLGKQACCNWPDHDRAGKLFENKGSFICSCATNTGGGCGWVMCVDCFTTATLDIKSPRQICKFQEGYTALIAAASAGQLECVKMLLANKADVNLSDPDGLTPLMAAVCGGNAEVVRLLLVHGANLNTITVAGVCALHIACELGSSGIVQALLECGPDLTTKDVRGVTALHAAAAYGHTAVMKLLLDMGASPLETNSMGESPLHVLHRDAAPEAVHLLVDRGAEFNPHSPKRYPGVVLNALGIEAEDSEGYTGVAGRRRSSHTTRFVYLKLSSGGYTPETVLSQAEIDSGGPSLERVILQTQQRLNGEDVDNPYFACALTQASRASRSLRASSRDEAGQYYLSQSRSTDDGGSSPTVRADSLSTREVTMGSERLSSRWGSCDSSSRTGTPPDRGMAASSSPRPGGFHKAAPGGGSGRQRAATITATGPGSSNLLEPLMNSSQSTDIMDIPRAYVRPPTRQPEPAPPLELLSPRTKELNDLKSIISSPLPLIRFNAVNEKHVATAKTITGECLRSIPNLTSAGPAKPSIPLCDPIYTRKIAKWFVKRSYKELNWRQVEHYGNHFGAAGGEEQRPDLLDVVVYESLLHAESVEERQERNLRRVPEEAVFQERYERAVAALAAKDGLGNGGSANSSGSALNSLAYSGSGRDLPSLGRSTSIDGANALPCYTPSLKFDGEFESGNLEKVVRVIGRETLLPSKPSDYANQDIICPEPVDQEYDLTLRKDINTDGNIQWYYFSATVGASGGVAATLTARSASSSHSQGGDSAVQSSGYSLNPSRCQSRAETPSLLAPVGVAPIKFPLRVRFNVVNMQKKDSLYNYGMRPATYSENQLSGEDWVHRGEDVCYFRSGITSVKSSKGRDKKKIMLQYQYTLTFTYTFDRPDTVYFAHTFPYTYSDLQLSLCRMEQKYRNSGFFHQRTLCETLAGNSCNVISISERSAGIIESKNKPAIVITARVHPGESNSSFMVQGFLDFITSDRPEALKLRKSFIFHVIPMLNPDGVIHGNYRCSLAATDLNRRYAAPHPSLHPTICAKKNFLRSTAENRKILLYLDLHGHSKLKNAFLYGCDITMQPERIAKHVSSALPAEDIRNRRIFSRVFPKVLSAVSNANDSGYFSYRDCAFMIDRSKYGTGRVVSWRDLHIAGSYTIEASFCGNGDNRECKILKRASEPVSAIASAMSGGGVKTAVTTTSSSRVLGKSATNSLLPLARPGTCGDAAAAAGIAYGGEAQPQAGAGGDSIIAGTVGIAGTDGPDDEATTDVVEDSKGEMKSRASRAKAGTGKGPARKNKLLRRSSTTPNIIRPAESSAVDNETALAELLQRYDAMVHYRKEDLLNMGRDIGLAIYHFANLSHSSVEQELAIATRAEAEGRAKQRRLQMMKEYTGSPPQTATSDRSQRRATSSAVSLGAPPPRSSGGDSYTSSPSASRGGKLPALGKTKPPTAAVAPVSRLAAYSAAEDASGEVSSDAPDSDIDLDPLPPTEVEAGRPEAAEAIAGTMGIAEPDQELDLCDDSGEDSGSESGDVDSTAPSSRPSEPVSASDLAFMMREYAMSTVEQMGADMTARSHLRPGVFSAAAIEHALQAYPQEFLTDGSSEHVGLRMKCEYNIRRALKYANEITLTDAALKQHNAGYLSQNEEEAGSVDGSDSNPSVDNVPATKMLKKVKKLRDTSRLVSELKKAAVRRRKKELELSRKLEKKEAKRLAQQASEARRIAEEAAQAQAAQEAKEAAALAAEKADAAACAMRDRSVARRKTSIFQSAPKHAPMYRLTPEDLKATPQLLPLKLVNFKEYDSTDPPHHGAYAGTKVRHDQHDGAAHASSHVVLPMSSLTSAVNKLYFQPVDDGPLPHVLAASNASALTRRHASAASPGPALGPAPADCASNRDGSPRASAMVRPTLHSMAPLLPASAVAGEISTRERERLSAILHVDLVGGQASAHAPALSGERTTPTARQRPKSGNPTIRRRII